MSEDNEVSAFNGERIMLSLKSGKTTHEYRTLREREIGEDYLFHNHDLRSGWCFL